MLYAQLCAEFTTDFSYRMIFLCLFWLQPRRVKRWKKRSEVTRASFKPLHGHVVYTRSISSVIEFGFLAQILDCHNLLISITLVFLANSFQSPNIQSFFPPKKSLVLLHDFWAIAALVERSLIDPIDLMGFVSMTTVSPLTIVWVVTWKGLQWWHQHLTETFQDV